MGEEDMHLEILGVNLALGDELRVHIERRLRSALGRFAARIGRLTVWLFEVNGPRGGHDKRWRIAVALVPRGMVMVGGSGDDPFALIADAANRRDGPFGASWSGGGAETCLFEHIERAPGDSGDRSRRRSSFVPTRIFGPGSPLERTL